MKGLDAKGVAKLLVESKRLLVRTVDSNLDTQLACLFEIQAFWVSLGSTKGYLLTLFKELCDSEIFMEKAFLSWKENVEDAPGKQAALFELNAWLQELEEQENEDDDEDEEDDE
eukprot:TRINITY_DN3125_c0_g2_i1.p2 TRINITY_DN3125_c0_g2~~TRINITY_DN3125_c0_g2_i1.p2  ORF type:complete len:114 (+),score=36.67 TRINITY_DN3125_c0_g2_i1:637-978(+)